MHTDDFFISKAKAAIEEQLHWGNSENWSNQDFSDLSELIFKGTGVQLSAVTLKRIWGRIKYNGAPSTTTLDALVKFVGHESWRAFKIAHTPQPLPAIHEIAAEPEKVLREDTKVDKKSFTIYSASLTIIAAAILTYAVYYFWRSPSAGSPGAYQFTSKTVVTEGVPNSVVFTIDASRSPADSVIIQQSWDKRLQVSIPKEQKQHTAIYYYPGSFSAKLLVGDQVVKEHHLLIKTKGWLPIIEQKPVPAFLKKEDVMQDGKMQFSVAAYKSKNIDITSSLPFVSFFNTQEFGEIYSDDFSFETALKNNYAEGVGVCQKTFILLQCIEQMIWVPLCAKGCVSDANLIFTSYNRSGKQSDLSAFGVDFSDYVKVKIISKDGKASILVNNRQAHTINQDIKKTQIVGIGLLFQGGGSVDYVMLSNNLVRFEDDF